jgi:hypothetical protein
VSPALNEPICAGHLDRRRKQEPRLLFRRRNSEGGDDGRSRRSSTQVTGLRANAYDGAPARGSFGTLSPTSQVQKYAKTLSRQDAKRVA